MTRSIRLAWRMAPSDESQVQPAGGSFVIRGSPPASLRKRDAFTLIELLVTLGIIAVVLSIGVGALAAARGSAKRVADVSHQRQVGAILMAYTGDHKGLFPYWGTPGVGESPLYGPGTGRFLWNELWIDHGYAWGHFIDQRGYDGWASAWTPSGPKRIKPTNPDYIWYSAHWLTYTAYAQPRWFAEESVFDPADRNIAQRISSAAFASSKGMLLLSEQGRNGEWVGGYDYGAEVYESPPGWKQRTLITTFIDGHSEARKWPDFRKPRRIPDANDGDSVLPVLNTVDGMLGRDI